MRYESFATRVEALLTSWEETKLLFERATDISKESLHIFAGVLIMLVAAGILRKPVSTRWPWLVVLAFAVLNEVIDLYVAQWPHPGMQFGESIKDLFVTMLLPSVLLFTAKKTPGIYRPRIRPALESAPDPVQEEPGTPTP
jgi:hypothetical protein